MSDFKGNYTLPDNPFFFGTTPLTISLSVTNGTSSCHVPQCKGSLWMDSNRISTASFTKSSFFNITPYL